MSMRAKAAVETRGIDFLSGAGGTVGYKPLETDTENRSQILSKNHPYSHPPSPLSCLH